MLLDLVAAEQALLANHLARQWPQGLTSQPLLMPFSLNLTPEQRQQWQAQQAWLQQLGVEARPARGEGLMLYRVPAVLRQTDLARQIPALLAQLADWPDEPQVAIRAVICGEFHIYRIVVMRLQGLEHLAHNLREIRIAQ